MSSYAYISHTRKEDNSVQPLSDHLLSTAKRAQTHAEPWGGEFAYMCGLAHDVGKYSETFQARIHGKKLRVDHSTGGGQLLHKSMQGSVLGLFAAYCVMGHHGGLPNGGSVSQDTSDDATLYGRLNRRVESYDAYKNELTLPRLEAFSQQIKDGFDGAFFIRMAFSALVDADWLDTEKFCNFGNAPRGGFLSLSALNALQTEHVERFLNPAGAISDLNQKRNQLLKDCLEAARLPGGLFSLTAPTGSGKTIASLAFALNHALRNDKQHIIYIVPYNTIIEQNASVFENILGAKNVLRHHSDAAYDGDDEATVNKRNSIENWDYPLIITSSVQFFESLFAHTPSKCRKLHNIANSVLIFDEAQMIPLPYLWPCVRAIKTLVTQYGCSAVLATATQSSLDTFFKPLQPTEIAKNPETLYVSLRRATITRLKEPLTDDSLAQRMLAHEQVLCIVNTRRHAQTLFERLYASEPDGCFHLSTTMYPAHRKRVLDKIHERLKAGLVSRVISTSLVEAGVDLDFQTVYREQAGLDNIVQAAGRCNREGKRAPDKSVVYVFSSTEHEPPRMMQPNIAAYNQISRCYDDVSDLDAIRAYFNQLYYYLGEDQLDAMGILSMFNDGAKAGMSFPFADAAAKFKLIDDGAQQTVYVLHEASELAERARSGERSRELFRALGAYAVSLYEHDMRKLKELGAVEQPDSSDASVMLLTQHYYNEQMGVSLTPEGGQGLMA